MKSSQQILSHLTSMPQFSSLVQHRCYRKFLDLLPPRFRNAIAFIYIKNHTLFLALSHPGYKMELNYNRELFKELLATLRTYAPECQNLVAEDVVLFNSKFHAPPTEELQTIPYYSELSSGEFTLELENEALKEKFLHAKTIILKNLSNYIE